MESEKVYYTCRVFTKYGIQQMSVSGCIAAGI